MANTLDLDPEGGDIDLIVEVEEAFAIRIADHEAAGCWTVGDLHDLVCARTPQWNDRDGSCASSAVFYRFRRSLAPVDKCALLPGSPLQRAGMPASRLVRFLSQETGLRLPAAEMTTIGAIGGWMCLVGVIIGVAALFKGAWEVSAIGGFAVALGALLLRIDPARMPFGVTTVGDLVRRTVPLNGHKLAETGARLPDRWDILAALAAEHGCLSPDEIGPDTFFSRKGRELATARD